MCGIAGIGGFGDKQLVKRMCDVQAYRGPDDSGYFTDNLISLGSRRLSIIDLSGGRQPIHNEDETIFLVLNGEIFNYLQLRKDLEKKGHKFYTSSDTETIVHAYEEYGQNCVHRLRGMFAFALWDAASKKLFLARDRLGINPLYYTLSGKSLFFASEIKSLLECRTIPKEVDYTALNDYLIFQAAVGPNTLFKGIKELLPGQHMTFENGSLTIADYWDVTDYRPYKLSDGAFCDKLMEKLDDAVKAHLVSDVPIGLYLSGGLDSSIVLSLMHKSYEAQINTFSVGFGHEEYDELKYAKIMADAVSAKHREVIINSSMLERDMGKIMWHLEDPIADFGEISNYYLSKLLNKDGIKVTLSGEGSDELFGGYPGHVLHSKRFKRIVPRILPHAVKYRMIPKISGHIPLYVPKSLGIKRFLEYFAGTDVYKSNGEIFALDSERKSLYGDWFYESSKANFGLSAAKAYFENPNIPLGNELTRAQYVDLKIYVDYQMLHEDKMNLAHSVEIRYPFLDHKLVEFAFRVPERLRIKDSIEKYILRKTVSRYNLIPREILNRRKKGFISPLEQWLSTDLWDYASSTILNSNLIKTTLNRNYVAYILRRRKDHWYAHKIWGLFILALWYETYFENESLDFTDLKL